MKRFLKSPPHKFVVWSFFFHTYGQFRITISTVLLIFGHTGWLQAQTEHANEPSYCYQSENNICYCLADLIWLSGCDCSLMDMGRWLFLWWKPSRMTWHVQASPPHTGKSSQLTERLHMLCISHTKVTVGCGERWRDKLGVGGGMDKGMWGRLTCHLSQRDKRKQR